MSSKIQIKLTGVPETLLISTRARYLESKRTNGIIHDPKTVEIMDAIEYDFSGDREVSKGSQVGTAIRTEILDEQTLVFLKKYPECVVVNLGCGLDTRFYRLDNGLIHWYDLDVPETINVRRSFFRESDRYHLISKSVLDFSWLKDIPNHKPTLIIAEGLLMYFEEYEVRAILKQIGKRFLQCEMLIEGMSPFIAKNSDKHADVKKYAATFKWGIKTGKEIDRWNIGLIFVAEFYYFDRHRSRVPFYLRWLCQIPAFRKMMKIIHLSTNY
jgi:O-methyltransferase involved in polyketide biosynthesis